MNARDLKSFAIAELQREFVLLGEPAFRAEQALEWAYRGVADFSQMTNLPKALRQKLSERFFVSTLSPKSVSDSSEIETARTVKFLFALEDGKEIETVLIPDFKSETQRRLTVCVSSQVGCAMACKFCATGYMGFTRNLTVGEIVGQVECAAKWARERWNQRITNVVFMGMGEPMLNYERVMEAAYILSAHRYPFQIGERRITLSTVGVVAGIDRLAESPLKINLAVSLHSAIEEKRRALMPIAREFSLAQLRRSLIAYYAKTKREIFIEYLLLDGVNDGEEDATALVKFARSVPSKINLIDYNPIANIDYRRSDEARKTRFREILRQAGLFASVRRSRGKDIDAACGQLATRSISKKTLKPV
ncbi:MAG: 23S rRNA (adenine(2503)-C(2))-methyltransferase RlmN [Chloroherpetonaceae bacterium]|nr:23S rRNA (adenine(2503)-C(2))-methyltransferase RlmN [Chloroherpetonaceae bacterium]MDW8437403.1 23S rRNA (adenine(2503)-C(2))-methyltransferase RlmN [Chloroherpetonaceae bacterium]